MKDGSVKTMNIAMQSLLCAVHHLLVDQKKNCAAKP